MSSFFISESGRLLDAAKRAAIDAVTGYTTVNPYTIGIAVQAAAAVLQAGESGIDPRPGPIAIVATPASKANAIDVGAVEVTPRMRALESVARAALATHAPHEATSDCLLCGALSQLDWLEQAS